MTRSPGPVPAALAALWLLGSPAARAQGPAADLALYPGAPTPPRHEHVYTYPLEDALAAARAVLEARGYEVHPAPGSTPGSAMELNTVWRQSGQQVTGRSRTQLQRRYHVSGQRLGPLQSVVRIFRVERVEDTVATRQPRAVDTTGVRNTEAGKSLGTLDGFRQEAERRQVEDDRRAYYKDDSRGTRGGPRGWTPRSATPTAASPPPTSRWTPRAT
jgi:hypothetical protein